MYYLTGEDLVLTMNKVISIPKTCTILSHDRTVNVDYNDLTDFTSS